MKLLLALLLFCIPSFAGVCDGSLIRLPISVSSGSGNVQIIPLVAARQIVICHISFNGDATSALKITQGTGTNCGSNTADVTGAYQGLAGISRDPTDGPLYLNVGYAACINFGGSTNAGGVVLYALR